jgi:HPt (histidine-containing phosphotransfer) domain-containing protein
MAEMLEFPTTIAEDVAAPPLAPDAYPIDRTHLFRMTLGDHALECEVLQLFDQQAEMLLARMREAEPAAIAALAHTLQGSARGVGAWNVARAAEALEASARAKIGKVAKLQPPMNDLSTATSEARAAIAELLRA